MKKLPMLWPALALLGLLALGRPASAQTATPRYSIFAADLFGSPNGFGLGGSVALALPSDFLIEPSLVIGRRQGQAIFTADGAFLYEFHPDDEVIIPYLLGGIGMAQYGGNTYGGVLAGFGARIPVHHQTWVQLELRAGRHGLGRFTLGLSKNF